MQPGAVAHAFLSEDHGLAARLVGQAMLTMHWSGRRATTRGWLRRFTDAVLLDHPWLAVLAGWEAVANGDVAALPPLVDIVERGAYETVPRRHGVVRVQPRDVASPDAEGVDDASSGGKRASPSGGWAGQDHALGTSPWRWSLQAAHGGAAGVQTRRWRREHGSSPQLRRAGLARCWPSSMRVVAAEGCSGG
jgi:hypothetical protein